MSGHYELTNADAPLQFDGEVIERCLRWLVELLDAVNPEMGGMPLTAETRPGHELDLTGLAYRMYGVVTYDRYTYVEDAPDGGAS
jgi:hypothetical protein